MSTFPEIPDTLPEKVAEHIELLRYKYDVYIKASSRTGYAEYFTDKARAVLQQVEHLLSDPSRSSHTSCPDTSDRDD